MRSRYCFVPCCRSGYKSKRQEKINSTRNPSIFRAPRNWQMLQIWQQVIPRADRKLSITDVVCELHFYDDDIIRNFETTCYDGQVFKLARKYPLLKKGAVPTRFPNLPEYSKNIKKIVDRMKPSLIQLFVKKETEAELAIQREIQSYFMKKAEAEKQLYVSSQCTENEVKNAAAEDADICTDDRSICEEDIDMNICAEDTSICADGTSICADDTSICADDTSICENMNIHLKDTSICEDTGTQAEDVRIHTGDKTVHVKDTSVDVAKDTSICTEGTSIHTEDMSAHETDEITFNMLVKNLDSIMKPNNSWAISSHDKFVICAKWSEGCVPEKRVIIDNELNATVYVNEKEDACYNNLVICSISDVSTLLFLIDH